MIDLFGGFPEHVLTTETTDVQLLDTTLRDGEQAPGISLSAEEKVSIARSLDRAGVDVIEAGSACTGPEERQAIDRVTDLALDARVTSFTRSIQADIDLALDCDVEGIHLVVPASDRHIQRKVGSDRQTVIERTRSLVRYAREHDLWVEVIGEDGSRADLDFLDQLMAAAIEAGADRICYADTVGYAGPERAFEVVSRLAEHGPTSTHTHDDLGLALTNALASIAAGADLVHATVNGIGERTGNAALEEVAIALQQCYDIETVDTTRLAELGRTVATATDIALPPNKAVVGEHAFTHESGIHTDGTLKDEAMYEPYPPEVVGRERRLVLGKHAGRAGVRAALADHDIEVSEEDLDTIVERVTELGQETRVTDADLLAIAEEVTGEDQTRRVELLDLTATSGAGTPTASVRIDVEGETRVASGTGTGPVDAAVTAVRKALDEPAVTLDSYHVDAITGGTDALVTVVVECSRGDDAVTISRSDTDITSASVGAMVDAMDRLLGRAAEMDPPVADD
jgi:D-citramalate synthase